MPREGLLARTFVELADTLVDHFDVVELLTLLTDRCAAVLDVAAASLILVAPEGDLRVVASSSEDLRLVELFEIQSQEGPCPDCYRTGQLALSPNLARDAGHWPRFGPVALKAGFQSVHALPMRLRGETIGALNLFRETEGALDEADVVAAQALADVATIAILQHRATVQAHVVVEQLNHALNSRIMIEQAKGMLVARVGLNMEDAVSWMRNHARSQGLHLVDVAQSVIDGTMTPDGWAGPPSPGTAVASQGSARSHSPQGGSDAQGGAADPDAG
jgi:transcriptional regulator with GAF, ATPase, and Fis domain